MPLTNVAPFSVYNSVPLLYQAAADTAEPLTTADPPGAPWTTLGTIGADAMGEDGVTVSLTEEIEDILGASSGAILKRSRTSEGMTVAFNLRDMTLEAWQLALNNNAVSGTTVKTIDFHRGNVVQTIALLARLPSPYKASGFLQFWWPRATLGGTSEVQFQRGGQGAALSFEFRILDNPSAGTTHARMGGLVADAA